MVQMRKTLRLGSQSSIPAPAREWMTFCATAPRTTTSGAGNGLYCEASSNETSCAVTVAFSRLTLIEPGVAQVVAPAAVSALKRFCASVEGAFAFTAVGV